jgi:hypothetical protein
MQNVKDTMQKQVEQSETLMLLQMMRQNKLFLEKRFRDDSQNLK